VPPSRVSGRGPRVASRPQPSDGSDDAGAFSDRDGGDDDDDAGAGIDDDGDDDVDVPLAAAGGACAHDAAAPGGGTGGEGSEGPGDWTTDDDDDVPLNLVSVHGPRVAGWPQPSDGSDDAGVRSRRDGGDDDDDAGACIDDDGGDDGDLISGGAALDGARPPDLHLGLSQSARAVARSAARSAAAPAASAVTYVAQLAPFVPKLQQGAGLGAAADAAAWLALATFVVGAVAEVDDLSDWRPFALFVMHNLWLPAVMSAFAEALVRVMLLPRAVSFAVFLRGVRGALRAADATPRTWAQTQARRIK
jgi:hypothetical protein